MSDENKFYEAQPKEFKLQQYYDFIIKVLSISKIGLVFSKDPYAIDNYLELQNIAMKELENFNKLKFNRPNYFERDIYPTPNVSVRTCIFDENGKVLLVREKDEGKYSLPGGWCDLYDSPSEAAKAECYQEAGAHIKDLNLIGVINRTPFKNFPSGVPLHKSVPEYAIIFRANLDGKLEDHMFETDDVGFFSIDNLPKFSEKVSEEEMIRIITSAYNNVLIFD